MFSPSSQQKFMQTNRFSLNEECIMQATPKGEYKNKQPQNFGFGIWKEQMITTNSSFPLTQVVCSVEFITFIQGYQQLQSFPIQLPNKKNLAFMVVQGPLKDLNNPLARPAPTTLISKHLYQQIQGMTTKDLLKNWVFHCQSHVIRCRKTMKIAFKKRVIFYIIFTIQPN